MRDVRTKYRRTMDQSFWQSRWDQGHIGFHREQVNPNLVRHGATWLSAPLARERILVPLAGKSVDVTWLAARGATVVAAEFVEQAVRSYFEESSLTPTVQPFEAGLRFEASMSADSSGRGEGKVEFLVSDFFKLKAEHVGNLTAVYDRAALVAINPDRRSEYVAQLAKLTPSGARLLLVSFTHDQTSGPPFSVSPEQVTQLLSPWFSLTMLADEDILEREPRYKDRGMTFVREHVWLGIRR